MARLVAPPVLLYSPPMLNDQARTRSGLLLGLGAYLIWGVLPLYFKLLAEVPATEIVAHRIVWSLLFLAALASIWKRWGPVKKALTTPKVALVLLLTAMLIGGNWVIWIWAVVNGHVLEGSLGYYLNPLVNVLLGVVLLREKLSRAQFFAVALAGAGVAVLAIGAGGALWISLSLAASFALYGFLRKITPVEAVEGLLIETAMLTPIALAWIMLLQSRGESGFAVDAAPTCYSCWRAPSRLSRCFSSPLQPSASLIRRSASSNISRRRCSFCWPCCCSERSSPCRTSSASGRSGQLW
jgi:chloramphenicol-sensitive protein RarD